MIRLGILNTEINGIHSAALILGAAGLCSRALGVLRDRLLAGSFGAGRELDIYYAAFQIPDFLNVLFMLGAASAAILPIFQEYLARDREAARRMISQLFTLFSAAAAVLAAAVFFLMPRLVPLITPGFSLEARQVTMGISRILLISPVVLGLSGILSAVSQSFGIFWAFALSPIFYNIGIIAGIFFLIPSFGIYGVAAGVILGVVGHIAVQFLVVSPLGFFPRFLWRGEREAIVKVLRLSLPRILAISLSHLTFILIVAFASTLAVGSIAVFQLAYNLYYLPVGIFGISYATAIFPKISRAWIVRDAAEFFSELFLGIRTMFFWLIPATVFFIVLRAHIVRVALGAGVFSWEDTRLTAAVLAALAVAMTADALSILAIRGFYALENTRVPLFINTATALVSVALAFLLAYVLSAPSFFQETATAIFRISDLAHPEVVGLALGFALGRAVNAFLMIGAVVRLSRRSFGGATSYPVSFRWLGEIISAALVAGFLAYLTRASFSATLPLISFMQVFWQGIISGLVGCAAYGAILWVWGNEEIRGILGVLHKKFLRTEVLLQSLNGDHP